MNDIDLQATDARALSLEREIREALPDASVAVHSSRENRGASLKVRLNGVTISIISDGYGKQSELWEAWDLIDGTDPAGWLDAAGVIEYIENQTDPSLH